MSDTLQSDNETEPEAPLAGMRLAAARRAQDISALDIAKELHLDEPKVRALEENKFDVLGAPVFAKGHLKKYAELVGVSKDDILIDYYALTRAAGSPPVVGRPRVQVRDYHLGRWIGGIVIVGLLAAAAMAAYRWYEQRAAEPVGQTTMGTLTQVVSPPEQRVDEAADSAAGSELPQASVAAIPEPVDGQSDAEPPPSDPGVELLDGGSLQAALPSSDVPQATLSMSFSGDCWTEVSDATGKRLFFDLGHSGRNVSVTGAAPLRVLFGDSVNVSVAINGQDYIIPDSMRSGRTARLTVNAQ